MADSLDATIFPMVLVAKTQSLVNIGASPNQGMLPATKPSTSHDVAHATKGPSNQIKYSQATKFKHQCHALSINLAPSTIEFLY